MLLYGDMVYTHIHNCIITPLVTHKCTHVHAPTHPHTPCICMQFSIDSGRAVVTHHRLEPYIVTSVTLGLGKVNDHFDGCFSALSINGHLIELAAVLVENVSNLTEYNSQNTTDLFHFEIEFLHADLGCQPGSECSDTPTPTCPDHSVCVDEWRGHSCACEDGFLATRERGGCVDPCDPSPCHNGGICSLEGGKPRCECPEGYSGQMCLQLESTSCPRGRYGPPDCRPCYCHLGGVTEGVCDASGRCLCNVSQHSHPSTCRRFKCM